MQLLLKYLTPLNILRFLGLFLSLSIALFFNLNWIFGKPAGGWLFVVALMLSIMIFRFGNGIEIHEQKDKKGLYIFIPLMALLLLMCVAYFHWRLDEPRYITPDPGTHYLYMSQTAKTGFLSSFLPDMMYVASGENESFRNHSTSYFPGASVPFYLIYNLTPTQYSTASLQIFNSVFFSLSVLYAFYLVKRSQIFRFRVSIAVMALMFGFGTFFDLVPMSFSTQLFGLFLLLFFFDTYHAFSERKMNLIVPSLALSGIVLSYVFWVPVAMLFVLVHFVGNRNFRQSIIVPVLSLILSVGYIKVLYAVSVLSHSTDDGGFKSAETFLSDISLILPFAVFGAIGIVRDIFRKKNILIGSLVFSSLIYSVLLGVAFHFDLVSKYVALKSLYLAIPFIWLAGIVQIEKMYENRNRIVGTFRQMWSHKSIFSKRSIAYVLVAIFFIVVPLAYAKLSGSDLDVMPLVRQNIDLVVSSGIARNITAEQLQFLDKLKSEYGWTLEDNRILVIAPFDTSLWAYAYSGVWPRTFSLLGAVKNAGAYSPMSFYSEGIANYENWLKNDNRHIVALFDNQASRSWQKKNAFRIDDYDILFSAGNNHLLRLKEAAETEFFHQEKYVDTYLLNSSGKNKLAVPYSGEIASSPGRLVGLSFMFSLKQRKISEDLSFTIRSGRCDKNGSSLYETTISKNELRNMEDGEYFLIRFNNPIGPITEDAACYSLHRENDDDSVFLIADPKRPDKPLMKELYLYENR